MKLTINTVGSPRVFKGVVTSVHDGDTFKALVDQGMGFWNHGITKAQDGLSIRLYGVNARELEDEGGPEARDFLAKALPPGTEVTLVSQKWDEYSGRIDCDVVLASGLPLIPILEAAQWVAGPYFGKGTKPVPPWPREAAVVLS